MGEVPLFLERTTPCIQWAQRQRGTSLIRNRPPAGPYISTCLGPCDGLRGGAVSYERGTPVERSGSDVVRVIRL